MILLVHRGFYNRLSACGSPSAVANAAQEREDGPFVHLVRIRRSV